MKQLLTLIVLACASYAVYCSIPETPQWSELSDFEWRQRLTQEQYEVLREAATEDAFSGPLNKETRDGIYRCVGCDSLLFLAGAKFDSGTGWPSFDDPAAQKSVSHRRHNTALGVAVEVRCATCKGHLGHVFPDGPTNTGNRYCINSIALKFEPTDGEGDATPE